MARKITIDKSMPTKRSYEAAAAKIQFRSVKFDHKTEPRGGTTNEQAELMAEYQDDCEDGCWD